MGTLVNFVENKRNRLNMLKIFPLWIMGGLELALNICPSEGIALAA
jgi:hypothetical protein